MTDRNDIGIPGSIGMEGAIGLTVSPEQRARIYAILDEERQRLSEDIAANQRRARRAFRIGLVGIALSLAGIIFALVR